MTAVLHNLHLWQLVWKAEVTLTMPSTTTGRYGQQRLAHEVKGKGAMRTYLLRARARGYANQRRRPCRLARISHAHGRFTNNLSS